MTVDADVRSHIDSAIEFAASGPDSGGRRYPRGKQLVTYLEQAYELAARLGHADISNRLADFSEYAAGQLPLAVLETRYVPGTREHEQIFMRQLLEVGLIRCVELLDEFMKDRPDATVQDTREWLRGVASAMEQWTVSDGRNGGVKLKHSRRDHLEWFKRVQLVLNDPLHQMSVSPEVASELAEVPGSELVVQAIQWRRRKSALNRLRTVIEDPGSSENDIHAELKNQTWIFGGSYVKELDRRRLAPGDEIDIPLLRGDGSLHVVELKTATVPNLLESPRSHCSVGPPVHRAVVQATNYLRSLDENRSTVLARYGIECRRAFATVLIGHPKFVERSYGSDEVADAFRTYNAALNRVEVMTYQELVDTADRSLALDDNL